MASIPVVDVCGDQTVLKTVLRAGVGDGLFPQTATKVTVDYVGTLVEDGTVFDKGNRFIFTIGRTPVIAGSVREQCSLVGVSAYRRVGVCAVCELRSSPCLYFC